MQQDAVVLERERPLWLGTVERRDAPRELRLAIRGDEPPDPLELLVRHARVPGPHHLEVGGDGAREIDELEQPVHGVADLGRLQARRSPATDPRSSRRPATRSA